MQNPLSETKATFLVDEKGRKQAIVLKLREYKHMLKNLEDLEDTNDLLRAEREATSFTPYEKFRKSWLKNCPTG